VKNGNIFGIKSVRLTKLTPLMNHISMVTNAPGSQWVQEIELCSNLQMFYFKGYKGTCI